MTSNIGTISNADPEPVGTSNETRDDLIPSNTSLSQPCNEENGPELANTVDLISSKKSLHSSSYYRATANDKLPPGFEQDLESDTQCDTDTLSHDRHTRDSIEDPGTVNDDGAIDVNVKDSASVLGDNLNVQTEDDATANHRKCDVIGVGAAGPPDHESLISTDDGQTATEQAGTQDDQRPPADPLCKATERCVCQSGDYRKVVSHVFGRNKKSTRELPKDFWILWCRKHYQRKSYRSKTQGNWQMIQLRLVYEQLVKFETLSNVQSWTIALRKKTRDALHAENAQRAAGIIPAGPPCWERFLIPHVGPNKTFADIRALLNLIGNAFTQPAFKALTAEEKDFPGIEFLPDFSATKVTKPARNHNVASAAKRKAPAAEAPEKRRRLLLGSDVDRSS